jgi:hypothetical protein
VVSRSGDELDGLTLGSLLSTIDEVPDDLIVYVPKDASIGASTPVTLLDFEAGRSRREELSYLLEVELIKDVIQAWSDWRNGRLPELADKMNAVIHYAEHDAYLPAE